MDQEILTKACEKLTALQMYIHMELWTKRLSFTRELKIKFVVN